MLRKVKKKIENEFLEATTHTTGVEEKTEEIEKVKVIKPKKVIAKNDKKPTNKAAKKETKSETQKKTQTQKKVTKR